MMTDQEREIGKLIVENRQLRLKLDDAEVEVRRLRQELLDIKGGQHGEEGQNTTKNRNV